MKQMSVCCKPKSGKRGRIIKTRIKKRSLVLSLRDGVDVEEGADGAHDLRSTPPQLRHVPTTLRSRTKDRARLFSRRTIDPSLTTPEVALVLVLFDHVASVVVNANHGIV